MTPLDQFHELSFYTLAHKDKSFIHQHIVDAYTTQTADTNSKPIGIFFALAGLYLFVEKGYTGKQVQDAHIQMTKKRKDYIKINLPESRGRITIKDVLDIPPGDKRDEMIRQWAVSVWKAFSEQHDEISLLTDKLIAK